MTNVGNTIEAIANRREITRLCHLTPSRNLSHIVSDPQGVLASIHLQHDEKAIFNPTDFKRLDGHEDHVCCSIQYPNVWYFRTAREREILFSDWVVLLINPRYLWAQGTKFCSRNAASGLGSNVQAGATAFQELFAPTVEGNRTFKRSPYHPDFLPTDQQAEVLILDCVERNDILSVVVRDKAQARREMARLRILDQELPQFLAVPEFYEPRVLNKMLRDGVIPNETLIGE